MIGGNLFIYSIMMREISDNGCISRQFWGPSMDSSLWSLQHGDYAIETEVQLPTFSLSHASDNCLLIPVDTHKAQPRYDQPKLKHLHSHKHKYSENTFISVFKLAPEAGEPDWLKVGALDPGRIGPLRGCCAEALVFVRSLIRVGYLYGLSFFRF